MLFRQNTRIDNIYFKLQNGNSDNCIVMFKKTLFSVVH